jgi:hypothetical protein
MRRFVASVLALSDDASAQNLTSYLAASRALDESRRSTAPRRAAIRQSGRR